MQPSVIKIKKPNRKPTRKKSTSSSSEGESNSQKPIKKQKQKIHSFQKATYSASNSASSLIKDTATRTIDVDGSSLPDSIKINDGFYHGQQSYTHTLSKNIKATQSSAGSLKGGVLYAPTNVRLTTRFDYNADVCKDYKETGILL